MRFGCVAHRARRFVGPVCVRWRRQNVRRVRVCACVVCVRAVRTRRPFGRAAARRRRRRKKYYRTLTSRHPRPTDNSGRIANTATAGGHLNHHHRRRHHHYCYYDYYYYCYYIMCTQTSHRLLLLSLYIVACIYIYIYSVITVYYDGILGFFRFLTQHCFYIIKKNTCMYNVYIIDNSNHNIIMVDLFFSNYFFPHRVI